ncbi:hypothetical protein [Fulvitalea axinellae]
MRQGTALPVFLRRFFIAGFFVFLFSGVSFSQCVKKVTIRQAFAEIERKSDYKVAFSKGDIDETQQVNFAFSESEKIGKQLKSLLEGTGLSFEIIDDQIIILPQKPDAVKKKSPNG